MPSQTGILQRVLAQAVDRRPDSDDFFFGAKLSLQFLGRLDASFGRYWRQTDSVPTSVNSAASLVASTLSRGQISFDGSLHAYARDFVLSPAISGGGLPIQNLRLSAFDWHTYLISIAVSGSPAVTSPAAKVSIATLNAFFMSAVGISSDPEVQMLSGVGRGFAIQGGTARLCPPPFSYLSLRELIDFKIHLDSNESHALCSAPPRIFNSFPRIGEIMSRLSPEDLMQHLYTLFGACGLKSDTPITVSSLAGLESILEINSKFIVKEGTAGEIWDGSLTNLRRMNEASTSSGASSGGSFLVPSLSTSARGELAAYVNEKQVLLTAIADVTLADETAAVATLKLVLANLNDKATRFAMSGNKQVSTAHPAFAVLGGLAKAYTIVIVVDALFEGTYFGRASRDNVTTLFQTEKVKNVIEKLFSEKLPSLDALIDIFGQFRLITVQVSSPKLFPDLCADPEEFGSFIDFVVNVTGVVGLDLSIWKELTIPSGKYFNIVQALRPHERAQARQRLMGPSVTQSWDSLGASLAVYNSVHSNYAAPPPVARLPDHPWEGASDALALRNTYDDLRAYGMDGGPSPAAAAFQSVSGSFALSGSSSSAQVSFASPLVKDNKRGLELGDVVPKKKALRAAAAVASSPKATKLGAKRSVAEATAIQEGRVLHWGELYFNTEAISKAFLSKHAGCRVDFLALCCSAKTLDLLHSKLPVDTTQEELKAYEEWWRSNRRSNFIVGPDFR